MSREATRGPRIYQIPSSWAGVLPSKRQPPPPPLLLLFQRRQVQRIDGGELSKLSTFLLFFLDGNDRRGLGSPHAVIERAAAALIVVNKRGERGRRFGGGFPSRWCPFLWAGEEQHRPPASLQQLLVVVVVVAAQLMRRWWTVLSAAQRGSSAPPRLLGASPRAPTCSPPVAAAASLSLSPSTGLWPGRPSLSRYFPPAGSSPLPWGSPTSVRPRCIVWSRWCRSGTSRATGSASPGWIRDTSTRLLSALLRTFWALGWTIRTNRMTPLWAKPPASTNSSDPGWWTSPPSPPWAPCATWTAAGTAVRVPRRPAWSTCTRWLRTCSPPGTKPSWRRKASRACSRPGSATRCPVCRPSRSCLRARSSTIWRSGTRSSPTRSSRALRRRRRSGWAAPVPATSPKFSPARSAGRWERKLQQLLLIMCKLHYQISAFHFSFFKFLSVCFWMDKKSKLLNNIFNMQKEKQTKERWTELIRVKNYYY